METTSDINEILQEKENILCVDCQSNNSKFISIYHGTLICESCSKVHESLSSSISLIKSLTDPLTASDYSYLTYGGNFKFLSFLTAYNIRHSKIPFKYRTYAVHYYREQLKHLVEKTSFNSPTPSIEEGQEAVPDIQEKPKNPFSYFSEPLEAGKTIIKKIKDSEKIKNIQDKTKNLITNLQEEIKTQADAGRQNITGFLDYGLGKIEKGRALSKDAISYSLEKSLEYGKETIEWGEKKARKSLERGKKFIKNSVEYGKEAVFEGTEKIKEIGKEKIKGALECGEGAINDGKELIIGGIEKGKDKIFKGIEFGKNTVCDGKELIFEKVEMGKDKIWQKVDYGKEKTVEGKELILGKVEESKDVIKKNFEYGKETFSNSVEVIKGEIEKSKGKVSEKIEEVGCIVTRIAGNGKEKVSSGVEGIVNKIIEKKEAALSYIRRENEEEESKETQDEGIVIMVNGVVDGDKH